MIVEELLATMGMKVDLDGFIEAEGAIGKVKFAVGALLGALGLHELKEMVHSVAEVGDAANKSSQKLGISAETLQELGYAAKLADVSQGQLEGAMFRLSRGMEKMATTGKGPVADAFKKLHINAKELKGEGLDANLEVIADAFAKMPDGQQKAALAMQLFGGAGKAMIPFLNAGSSGIREMREEAQKLGIIISDDLAKDFEEFNDDQTRLSEAWRGLKVQIVSALLPALHEMVTKLLDWVKANGDVIRGGLQAVLWLVVTAFEAVGGAISEVIDFVRTSVKFFDQHRLVALAVAAAILYFVVPAMVAWALAMAPVVAEWLILNAPIVAIIAGITALILLVNHWGEIWPVVTEKASAAWDAITLKVGSAWSSIKTALSDAGNAVVEVFASIGARIVLAVTEGFDYIVERARGLASDVGDYIEHIPVIGRIISGVADLAYGSDTTTAAAREASDAVAGAQQASNSVTFGSTSVTIQASAGMDEEKLAKLAADKASEAQRTMLADAYDSMRGGKR